MNKYKYLLLTIFLSFILLPMIAYAECTNEEIEHFKEVEDEYKVTYEFNMDTKDYTITSYAPFPDEFDYILYIGEDTKYDAITPSEYKFYNVLPGTYNVEIAGMTETCDRTLKIEKLILPEYNNYSSDPLCEGIEEFVLCQPTYGKMITYEEFVDRVNVYKKTKANKEQEKEEKKSIKPILDYIENNLFQIIIIIVFAIALIITIILTAKSIRKSRRLE